MATKPIVAGDLYESITGQLFELGRQLRQLSGYPFNPHLLKLHLQNAIEGKFDGANLIDPRFELLMEFKVTVPTDYDHGTQLSTLKKKKEFDDAITDRNFRKATQKLVPGKTYKAKLFSIRRTVNSDDCLSLYKAIRAILTGAQGMSLVCQLKKDVLPKGKCTVSFDEKDALWQDSGGSHRVPYVSVGSGGGFGFYPGYFELDWNSGFVVLCLCDCDE